MSLFLLGNIVAFVGALFMVGIGFMHDKRRILLCQNMQFLIMGIGNLLLGGVSGFVADIVSIFRNIFCLKRELTKGWKVFFIIIQVCVSTVFIGIAGFAPREILPIAATLTYTWMLDTKKETVLKIVMLATQLMWLAYDISLLNISSMVFDFLTIGSNIVGFIRARKHEALEA
ncbi:MAG: YgjV family protein [Lachnospiraceae bacterium]|nr:YgjV family protein [Lachnospiraceae bacterium]